MKKQLLLAFFILVSIATYAQPPKTPPKEFPTTIPKHELGTPHANVQQLSKITLGSIITSFTWRGARTWKNATSITVDSVLTVQFTSNGTVTWVKQGWEYVPRTAGNYTINGNYILIQFNYPPYNHILEGTYNPTTGKITGTFKEVRSIDANAPPAYQSGTTLGDFNFYRK